MTLHQMLTAACFRGFEKGLAYRGGWREEFPPAQIRAFFLYPFSYSSLRRRQTQFWGTIFAAFGQKGKSAINLSNLGKFCQI